MIRLCVTTRLLFVPPLLAAAAVIGVAGSSAHADLLVSSAFTDQVLRYGDDGAFIDVFASGNGLTFPQGLTFGPDGNLYVASSPINNASVLRYDGTTGAFIDAFASDPDADNNLGLELPRGLTFGPDGNLYVSAEDTNQVLRFNGTTGAFIDVFSDGVGSPRGLTFGPDGNLYVTRGNGDVVKRFDGTTGDFVDDFVDQADLNPFDLTFGPDGNLYVTSEGNNDVRRFDGTNGDFIDSFASGGGLDIPRGLLFGPDGNLYVSSKETDEVLRYNGTTGVFMDAFVAADSGGLDFPAFLTFSPSSAVPEPSTLLLFGSGLAGLWLWRRMRKSGVSGPSSLKN